MLGKVEEDWRPREAELRQAFAEAVHQFSMGSLPVGLDVAAIRSESAERGSALEDNSFLQERNLQNVAKIKVGE